MREADEREDRSTRAVIDRMQLGFRDLNLTVKELNGTLDAIKREVGVLDVKTTQHNTTLEHVVTNGKLLGILIAAIGLIFSIVWTVMQATKTDLKEHTREIETSLMQRVNEAERRIDDASKLLIERAQHSPPLTPLVEPKRRK